MTEKLKTVVPQLLSWYRENARELPWRSPATPYRVWVSEVMLQQTRIEAVIPYFKRFMDELPTVADLAAVPDDRLMKLWEGLGYYSRARNLKKAAGIVVQQHGGRLPAEYDALRALPGFGEYTAGAVASIAFGIPVPAVDGNVLRVMARLTADFEDVMRTAVRRRHAEMVRALIPHEAAGDFNAAIMELGERVCLPNTTPHCERCPLASVCRGHAEKVASLLPVRAPKKARRVEQRTVLLIISEEKTPRVLLHRRPPKGLLAGLWELPNIEGTFSLDVASDAAQSLGATVQSRRAVGEGTHLFSHVEWQMTGVEIRTSPFSLPEDYVWATLHEVYENYALPSAFRPFSNLLPIFLEKERMS